MSRLPIAPVAPAGNISTLAIDGAIGKRQASFVPAGAVVKVVSGPTSAGDRMVDVLWDGKIVTMFAIDVNVRGTEILDDGASVNLVATAGAASANHTENDDLQRPGDVYSHESRRHLRHLHRSGRRQ